MRRVGPMVCVQCGARDTPLYNGSTYVCRKCGTELHPSTSSGRPEPAAGRRAAAPARPVAPTRASKRPVKKCPYCGAVLAVETLRCGYCGSSLTREARDLATLTSQNLRLRFWLGCLLTASVFLFCILLYALVHRPGAEARSKAAVPATSAPAEPRPRTPDRADPLAAKVDALERQLARLQTALAEAKSAKPPAAAKAPTPRPEVKPPKPRPKPPTPKVATPPKPKPAKPKPPKPEKPSPAKLAAAAYPALQARLKKLKAERNYADAIAACRQFLAAHLDTPHGRRVAADQKALRARIERTRDDHVTRFRKAMADGDLATARAVAADLERYKAPELRDDRKRMLAEILAAKQRPQRDRARYLTQWKTPPHVTRLVAQLERRGDTGARSAAAKELGRHRHSAAIGPLIQAINDPDWYVANLVIKALADIGDPIALPDVARRTRALHPGVYAPAAQACRALAAADRKKHAEAWKLADVRQAVSDITEALTRIPKEESRVTSGFRIDLVETITLLGAKEAVPAIRTLLKARDEAVRAAAQAAIKKLTSAKLAANEPPKPTPPPKPKPAPKTTKPPEPKPPETPKPAPPKPKPPAKPKAKPAAAKGADEPPPKPPETPDPTPPKQAETPKPPAKPKATPPPPKPQPTPAAKPSK